MSRLFPLLLSPVMVCSWEQSHAWRWLRAPFLAQLLVAAKSFPTHVGMARSLVLSVTKVAILFPTHVGMARQAPRTSGDFARGSHFTC